MSAQVSLDQLLSHRGTLDHIGGWIEALSRGDEGSFWRALKAHMPLGDLGVYDEPLCQPVDWRLLREGGEGKMFGLLSACDERGRLYYLRAYSGQLQGAWLRSGWAPPLFDPQRVALDSWETQGRLHLINRMIQEKSGDLRALKRARRGLSQTLTLHLIEAYLLRRRVASRLEERSLSALWPSAPLGAGDCCAPKLLCWAASLGLTPLGLAEFWWGAERGPHRAGERYRPCQERCAPLLPWLLGDR